MQYKVLQIQLTDAEVDMVNKGVEVRKHVLKTWMFGKHVVKNAKKALDADYYDHVADIVDASNLEDAYYIGNHIPDNLGLLTSEERQMMDEHFDCGDTEYAIKMHADTMSSLSVGDILVDENDWAFVVDTFGFQMLPEKIAAVQ